VKKVLSEDHDYLELMVKVKEEVNEEEDEQEQHLVQTPLADFSALSRLAEISLAVEGRSEDADLNERVRLHQRQQQQEDEANVTLPVVGGRTMQIVLPEDATHIIVCTKNNNGKKADKARKMASNKIKSAASESEEGHICSDCGKRYSTSSNLARHKQTHRSINDKKAKKCPVCDKIYVSMPAFSMHMRTHNQTCKCDICGKSFSRPWLLQGHIRTHTGTYKELTMRTIFKPFSRR